MKTFFTSIFILTFIAFAAKQVYAQPGNPGGGGPPGPPPDPDHPSITNFTPASGPVGSSVTINGSGFNSTPSNNIVYFGATKATVTTATATQLTVTVPVGATYQPITVETNGLQAYSSLPFATTYPGWGAVDAATFVSKTDFSTGSSPYSVSVGDFDGDGKSDLAVANYGSNTISIYQNNSTGVGVVSYAAKIDYATNTNPRSVSIGDLDGDGKADLAVVNWVSNNISIFRNTSSGGFVSFATKIDFATGASPVSVSIGDIDGDGRADLGVANFGSNSFSILRNTGTAAGSISFAAKVDYANSTNPYSISLGDLDGDAKADVAVTNHYGNNVSVYRNTSTSAGSVSFASRIDFVTGVTPHAVSIGDLDLDGKLDVAVANTSSNTVSILRNTSTVGSIGFASKIDYSTGSTPNWVSIGDLDGDGKSDLAVANGGNNSSVSVLRNTSSGAGSISYTTNVDYVTGTGTTTSTISVSIGDFDGDGKSDLVAANSGVGTMSVFLHQRGARQTIDSFNPFSQKTYGDAAFSLSATASSGLPVTYNSSTPSVATVSGNTITIVGYGTTTITATQAGDSYYGPVSVSQILAVGPFPSITSFMPASGPVGTSVTINGSGFNSTPSNNIVYFGATRATVTAATSTQLTVTVPVVA